MKKMEGGQLHINITASNYTLKKKTLEGRKYLVFPVTMMVEGVHNGSQGPILHPITELGKIPASWNGIPIVINHPEVDGVPISANTPEVLEESAVGKVFNTHVKNTKLQADAWLEEEKITTVSPETLASLKEGAPIEVSVGVFTDYEEEPGKWNEEDYIKVAINHRPDHLALLPNTTGACSIADGCGCGFSVNKVGDVTIKEGQILKVLQSLNKMGYSSYQIGEKVAAEDVVGYKAKIDLMHSILHSLDSKDSYCYMEELYDNSVIYSKRPPEKTIMYKQDYKIESGKIEFLGTPVEVRREAAYVLNQLFRTKFKNKEVQMAEECTPCIKKKVDELITNSSGRWTEGDREFLQTLKEDQLTRMAPTEKIVEKIVEKEVQVNALTDDQKAALAFGEKQLKERRLQMVTGIQVNTSKEIWPDDVLATMKEDTLERVYNSVKKAKEEVVDYSFMGEGANLQNNAGDVVPMLPGGFGETKK